MNRKQIIRTIVFFILVFFVLVFLCSLFKYKISNISRRYQTFKELEDNTVDAVFVGSSGVDRYWIAAKAYDEYGMTVYPLSSEGLPSWLVKNMIVEAVDRQNPKLILIDTRPFTTSEVASTVTLADTRARRVVDMLDFFSLNRLDAIKRSVAEMDKIDEESTKFDLATSYYLSFIRYHNKWSDDTFSFNELKQEKAAYLGFYIWKGSSIKQYKKASDPELTEKREPLDEIAEKYLYELIDYIKEEKLDVLFVDTPYSVKEEGMARRNTLFDIFEENDIPYITYNTADAYEALDLNFKEDFYNSNHVNYYGAEKFTGAFMQYLHDNYDLTDHRDDADCADDWNGIYKKIKKRIKKIVETGE